MDNLSDDILKKAVPIIVDELDPEEIILFGSRAIGTEKPDSDYDILVIKNFHGNHRKYLKNLYLKLFGIGVPIDLILVSKEQLEQNHNNSFYFYKNALHEGLSLYEKKRNN